MSRISLLIMSQRLLKVSTLCPHTCTKTATPLVSCFVNDALVHTCHAKRAANAASIRQYHLIAIGQLSAIYEEYLTNWK